MKFEYLYFDESTCTTKINQMFGPVFEGLASPTSVRLREFLEFALNLIYFNFDTEPVIIKVEKGMTLSKHFR